MAGKKARTKASKVPKTDETAFCKQFDAFELRAAPGKGIGAFATRAMAAGTSFHKETALMTFTKPHCLITELDVARAYRLLSVADKAIFDSARHEPDHAPNCKCKIGVLNANHFSGSQFDHSSLYPISSRFNHACDANVLMLSPKEGIRDDSHTFRTIKDVQPGEELSFSYTSRFNFMTTAERQEELSGEHFGFQCLCCHCQLPAAVRLVSDMRRVLIRHLHFRLRKCDIDEKSMTPDAIRNSVADPKLVKNGAYSLLYAKLLEAEGNTSSPDSHLAYALTAWHVLNVAHHDKVTHISPRVVQDMRVWMRKSEDNIRLQYGDDLTEGGDMWLGIRDAMHPVCVPDDGKLEWEALNLVAQLHAKKSRIRLFTLAPP